MAATEEPVRSTGGEAEKETPAGEAKAAEAKAPEAKEEAAVPAPAQPEEDAGSDVAVLDVSAAMDICANDREFLLSLLEELQSVLDTKVEEMKAALDEIGEAITVDAADVVYRAAHSLKGGAAQLSALALAKVASETQTRGQKALQLAKAAASQEELIAEAKVLRALLASIEREGKRLSEAVAKLNAEEAS